MGRQADSALEQRRVPPAPVIRPLASMSPTLFTNLRKCRLRGLWSMGRHHGLLPRHPSAVLGNVAHKVIEVYGRSPGKPLGDFEKCWAEILGYYERQMSGNWPEHHLVPIRDWLNDYSMKKTLCRQAVESMQGRTRYDGQGRSPRRLGSELFLSTPDGSCSGRADLVRMTIDGLEIVDYKTGRAFLDNLWLEGAGAPEDAEAQLKLYAGMYFLSYGVWASSLKVMIGNNHINVAFTREECLALVDEARRALSGVNTVIRSNAYSLRDLQEALASPSPGNCQFCKCRPICQMYWIVRAGSTDPGWPLDVRGVATTVTRWGENRRQVTIHQDGTDTLVSIVGLSPGRHVEIREGSAMLSVFSLNPHGREASSFKEGPLTTIYLA